MSLADWMNDIDGGYAERERMAAWGGHEDNCDCHVCEEERENKQVDDEYQQYLNDPNTQEEE